MRIVGPCVGATRAWMDGSSYELLFALFGLGFTVLRLGFRGSGFRIFWFRVGFICKVESN